jgi:hypothetical protein
MHRLDQKRFAKLVSEFKNFVLGLSRTVLASTNGGNRGNVAMLMFWKKRDTALEERARLYREEGMRRADQLMHVAKGAFLRECFLDPEFAKFAADGGAKMQLSFELQFLWGFFHEHVQTADLPVNGYDRIKLHLTERLVTVHGYDIKRAAAEANAVEDLFNSDAPLFTAIAKLGQRSYKIPFEKSMVVAYRAMMT